MSGKLLQVQHFMEKRSLNEAYAFLNMCPSDYGFMTSDSFSLFKLNGTTGFYRMEDSQYSNPIDDLHTKADKLLIEKLLEYYGALINYPSNYRSMLYYAWENDPVANNTLKKAIEETKETTILIVVGYSFPYFNLEIDRKILLSMKSLRKIYFQAPENDVEKLIDSYRNLDQNSGRLELIPRPNTEQFFIPPEN